MRHCISPSSAGGPRLRPFLSGGLALLLFAAFACAPRNTHPDIDVRARSVRTIGVLRPQVEIYQMSAGGQVQMIEDWAAQGRNNVLAAVVQALGSRRAKLAVVELDAATADELEEVLPLYQAVGDSIARRTGPGSPPFDRRPKRFEYSVGSLDRIAERHGVDALLVLTGYDEISTYGRRALIAIGKITGILFGRPPATGATVLTIGLLDRDGTVLWFGALEDRGGYDLRRRGSAGEAVRKVLETFPEAIP
jgi:hypothetical protein